MPAQESAFRNLILNQRIASETRFINRSDWVLNNAVPNIPVGSRVFAGLDIGAVGSRRDRRLYEGLIGPIMSSAMTTDCRRHFERAK